MKNSLKGKMHEIVLIVSYALMVLLLIWISIQSNKNGDNSGFIYSVILFAVVLLMYLYSLYCFVQTNKITNSMRNTTQRIRGEYTMSKELLWDKYKDRNNLFDEKTLDFKYSKFCKEQSRLAAIGNNATGGSIEDYINYELIDDKIHKNILSIFPGTMTGLGILFTFVGLSVCLRSFHTGTVEEIMAGIDPLMGGLRVAFHTSIYGLVFSLIYNFSYRRELEDSYEAVDELIETFTECVKPENENDLLNTLIDNQNLQSKALSAIVTHLETGMSEALDATVSPQFTKLNNTISDFATAAGEAQSEGIRKMVEAFLEEMNKSVGDNFKEVRDSMAKTCEVQGQYTESIEKSTKEITDAMKQVGGVSSELQAIVQQFEGYISSIRLLQEKIQESFDSYSAQIADNEKLAQNQQQYMEEIANAQKTISDNLTSLVSETESCLTKLQEESSRFVETAEITTTTIIQKSEEWTEKMSASVSSTEQRMQQAENDISNSARNSLASITQSVEAFGQTLSKQASDQTQDIIELKEQVSNNLSESAQKLENAVSQLSVKVSDAMAKGLSEYDTELQTTIKELNDTVRSVRTSTGNVPRVISDAQRELESAIQQTEEHLNRLLNALDQMQQKTTARQQAFAEEEQKYEKIKSEIEDSVTEIKNQKEQMQQLVNVLKARQDNMADETVVGNENNADASVYDDTKTTPKEEDVVESPDSSDKEKNSNPEDQGSGEDFSLAGLDFSEMK